MEKQGTLYNIQYTKWFNDLPSSIMSFIFILLMFDLFALLSSFRRRVHISEKTLSFLNGEFEVEPAFGEKREEALRVAGLKTFFITKVIKPVKN